MIDKVIKPNGKGMNWFIRNQELQFREPIIMGILNVTPDSFSDSGAFHSLDSAVTHAHKMINAGTDIIDIGGESTRPGASAVSVDQELSRVIPVIEAITSSSEVIISVDTQKPEVAQAALENGAHIINDISGGQYDESMFEVVADYKAGYVMMHMQGNPKTMQEAPAYGDIVDDIKAFFTQQIEKAVAAGMDKSQIVLDPGIGFGKTLDNNLTILANIEKYHTHKLPLLIGASRKSFIGMIDNSSVSERLGGSLATVISAYMKNVQIFRVHDIAETRQTLNIFTAIQSHLD